MNIEWKLVPVEPTEEIVQAIALAVHCDKNGADIWAAGFEAAPQPPSVGGETIGYIVAGSLLANTRERAEGLARDGKYEIIEAVDRVALTARDQQIAGLQLKYEAARNRSDSIVHLKGQIAELQAAVQANHEWHQQYDDHDGYAGSALEQTNLAALAQQVNRP